MTTRRILPSSLLLLASAIPFGGHAGTGIGNDPEFTPYDSQKLAKGHGNPLLDFHFTADPTVVEHEGRLYVYATNDHQQYEAVGGDGKNSYEKIKSLVMMSTDDMVNWTYHGIIDVEEIAPWIIASWAPSVVKREEEDGKTHFYLYFSNSGYGTGVITATSPVGPWSSPLDRSLIDAETPGLGDCKVPFDPGAVIDPDGTGWLAVGAGKARIMRLGKDLTSIDSEIMDIPAPHHFEANELNYIDGTYVYTYNTDWQDYSDWSVSDEKPTICSMCYMTSKIPLDPASWKFRHNYLKNSGDYGYTYTNNHTHLHKFRDRWYLFYHSMELQKTFGTEGGFRNVCVDEIKVEEPGINIAMGNQSLEGTAQIKPLDPYAVQQAETTAATRGVKFYHSSTPGNMTARPAADEAIVMVKGALFDRIPAKCDITASGEGRIEIRGGSADGAVIASADIDSENMKIHEADVTGKVGNGPIDIYFILKGKDLDFDMWQFR